MTTEAVVINRIGVALATDSAVTISGGGKSKVFDTGDKLFEFDLAYPVGLMINGNMDWLGVPWELLIKDFRERPKRKRKSTLQESLRAFLDFASTHKANGPAPEAVFVRGTVWRLFERIKRDVQMHLLNSEEEPGDVNKRVVELVDSKAKEMRAWLDDAPKADSLGEVSAEDIIARYGQVFDELIVERFEPVEIPPAVSSTLKDMAVAALLSSRRSTSSTGIIVAGFAPGDLFPSLAIADVDGAVCGKLKFSFQEGLTIDRTDNPGRVISFAQTDVADRLLSGADQQFVSKTAEFIEESLSKSKESLVEALANAGMNADEASAVFDVIIKATGDEFQTEFWKEAREEFQDDFNQMVALMPKQETIELAEAIVSITAIERKASADQATVGGPVDVAFITRHEGFVWIKRKHYFDKELNPRYFTRRFSRPTTGEAA